MNGKLQRIGRRLSLGWLGLVLSFCVVTVSAVAALGPIGGGGTTRLERIVNASLPGNRIELRLEMSRPMTEKPLSFHIDSPARIALDFPNTVSGLSKKVEPIGVGPVEQVTVVEANGRARVVIQLTTLTPYEVLTEGNAVLVRIESSKEATGTLKPADVAAPAITASAARAAAPLPERRAEPATGSGAAPKAAASSSVISSAAATAAQPLATEIPVRGALPGADKGGSIRSIDFRQGDKAEGRLIVALSHQGIGIDIRQEGEKVVVDFASTSLPEALNKRLDMTDFNTPVKEVDVQRLKDMTRMVITPRNPDYEYLAYQTDNIFTVELKAMSRQAIEERKKSEFMGEKLSLNFQNIDVRAVLQLLADFTGKNLVASDTVVGKVTLRLKNVPWDQALAIILRSKGLAMREAGNVLMVAPMDEMAAREQAELEAQKKLTELSPVKTEYIQLNYAKAADLATLIKAKDNNLLSDRGAVATDERTNTLLLQDTPEKLAQIRTMIKSLDIPVRQVMIESRIVIATENFEKALGSKFGWSQLGGAGKSTDPTKQAEGLTTFVGGGISGDTKYGRYGPTYVNNNGQLNYITNLGIAPNTAFRWAIGRMGSFLVNMELQAMQLEQRGEVLSSPRVVTADQKAATIERGVDIPYLTASASGATTVSYRRAAMSLKVTPRITPEDRVLLELDVHRDTVGDPVPTGLGSSITINTQSVQTQVLVDNGETAVLGGILNNEKRRASQKVPVLGDIPYLGSAFRSVDDTDLKNEMLIFVTPKIIKEAVVSTAH